MKITQEINYLLNYKPLLNFKKEIKNINLIYCKNFFLFFLLFETLLKLNKISKKNMSLTIMKDKKYLNKSLLRAPNKYKKAQIKLELIRYKIKFKFNFFYNIFFIRNVNLNFLIYFINFFFYSILFFESTLFFLKKKKVILTFNSKFINKFLLEL